MTALQMNAELFRELSIIAESESLMEKLLKYAKKLTAKKADETLETKEEYFASIERGEEEYRQGKTVRLLEGETVTDMLRRCGYDI